MKTRVLSLLTAATMLSSSAMIAVPAVAGELNNNTTRTVVKQAATGAVIGTAAGALSKESSIWKGLGIGALVGAGTGLVDSSSTMNRHPLVKSAGKGAIVGTGAGAVLGGGAGKGALVGAGAGTGLHFLKKVIDRY